MQSMISRLDVRTKKMQSKTSRLNPITKKMQSMTKKMQSMNAIYDTDIGYYEKKTYTRAQDLSLTVVCKMKLGNSQNKPFGVTTLAKFKSIFLCKRKVCFAKH